MATDSGSHASASVLNGVLNLKTDKALGIDVPTALLAARRQVLELANPCALLRCMRPVMARSGSSLRCRDSSAVGTQPDMARKSCVCACNTRHALLSFLRLLPRGRRSHHSPASTTGAGAVIGSAPRRKLGGLSLIFVCHLPEYPSDFPVRRTVLWKPSPFTRTATDPKILAGIEAAALEARSRVA